MRHLHVNVVAGCSERANLGMSTGVLGLSVSKAGSLSEEWLFVICQCSDLTGTSFWRSHVALACAICLVEASLTGRTAFHTWRARNTTVGKLHALDADPRLHCCSLICDVLVGVLWVALCEVVTTGVQTEVLELVKANARHGTALKEVLVRPVRTARTKLHGISPHKRRIRVVEAVVRPRHAKHEALPTFRRVDYRSLIGKRVENVLVPKVSVRVRIVAHPRRGSRSSHADALAIEALRGGVGVHLLNEIQCPPSL